MAQRHDLIEITFRMIFTAEKNVTLLSQTDFHSKALERLKWQTKGRIAYTYNKKDAYY